MTTLDLLNKIESNNGSYTYSYKKKVCELDTDVQALKEHISGLSKNVKSLKNYNSEETIKSKVERHLKKIVKSYNELKKKTGEIKDSELNAQLSKLDSLFSENEKDLKKIGIRQDNGKLRFDSDIFDDAEAKDIDKLFVGKKSFIRQLDKIMNNVSDSADDAEYSNVTRKISRIATYSKEDRLIANSFVLTDGLIDVMNSYSKIEYEAASGDGIKDNLSDDELKKDLELFSKHAYKKDLIDLDKSKNQEKIKQLCEAQKEKLGKIGITFDIDGYMQFDNTINIKIDDFKNAFVSLFGTNAEFGKSVQNCCQDGFNKIIDPEKLGVSIIDAYV